MDDEVLLTKKTTDTTPKTKGNLYVPLYNTKNDEETKVENRNDLA